MAGHEDAGYADENGVYDVVVVGGGTAGAVVASRLSEDPDRSVCLVEGGPSDVGDERLRALRRWPDLFGSELDDDVGTAATAESPGLRQSRGRVLGGCSSTGAGAAFRPLPGDWDAWVAAGAAGWEHLAMSPYWVRLLTTIQPVAEPDRSPLAADFVQAASGALGVPELASFNTVPFTDGAGFAPVAYDPEDNARSSASAAYLHPFLSRPHLTVLTDTWVTRLETASGAVTGVCVQTAGGASRVLRAEEVVLCAGAVDTPRLLLHSGLGPAAALRDLGIEVVADLPGVGENLQDHPETALVYATRKPLPSPSATEADAVAFTRPGPGDVPDLRLRLSQVLPSEHLAGLGHEVPEHGVCVEVGVTRPASRGSVRLTSADPSVPPALDFAYLSDGDGHDAEVLVEGVRAAREVATSEPLASWLADEVAPGPDVTDEAAVTDYVRRAVRTAHHPAGTCAMGAEGDPSAVVGPDLKVRGLSNLRVADASVFPSLPVVDPMVAVLMVGERAADLMARGRPVI